MERVVAYHLILTTYGFWLPNDPRGSWSDFVRAWELLKYGPATKTDNHRSVARVEHDRQLRLAAKRAMARVPVMLSGRQALAVGRGFGNYIRKSGLDVTAGVVMPDHAHLVVMRHRYSIEQIGNLLKGSATRQLSAEELHPFQADRYRDGTIPTPWARKQWSVFLGESDVERAIKYVQDNPAKAGLPPQRWSWITPRK